jgi:hypothetical protein
MTHKKQKNLTAANVKFLGNSLQKTPFILGPPRQQGAFGDLFNCSSDATKVIKIFPQEHESQRPMVKDERVIAEVMIQKSFAAQGGAPKVVKEYVFIDAQEQSFCVIVMDKVTFPKVITLEDFFLALKRCLELCLCLGYTYLDFHPGHFALDKEGRYILIDYGIMINGYYPETLLEWIVGYYASKWAKILFPQSETEELGIFSFVDALYTWIDVDMEKEIISSPLQGDQTWRQVHFPSGSQQFTTSLARSKYWISVRLFGNQCLKSKNLKEREGSRQAYFYETTYEVYSLYVKLKDLIFQEKIQLNEKQEAHLYGMAQYIWTQGHLKSTPFTDQDLLDEIRLQFDLQNSTRQPPLELSMEQHSNLTSPQPSIETIMELVRKSVETLEPPLSPLKLSQKTNEKSQTKKRANGQPKSTPTKKPKTTFEPIIIQDESPLTNLQNKQKQKEEAEKQKQAISKYAQIHFRLSDEFLKNIRLKWLFTLVSLEFQVPEKLRSKLEEYENAFHDSFNPRTFDVDCQRQFLNYLKKFFQVNDSGILPIIDKCVNSAKHLNSDQKAKALNRVVISEVLTPIEEKVQEYLDTLNSSTSL